MLKKIQMINFFKFYSLFFFTHLIELTFMTAFNVILLIIWTQSRPSYRSTMLGLHTNPASPTTFNFLRESIPTLSKNSTNQKQHTKRAAEKFHDFRNF